MNILNPKIFLNLQNVYFVFSSHQNMKGFFPILMIMVLSVNLTGQIKDIGTPDIVNYSKSAYNAGTQNWDITQDKKGFMYFANNEGILVFDGIHWYLVNDHISTPTRSVHAAEDGKIYVGHQNDFGYLTYDDNQLFKYKSLRHLVPDSIQDFNDIWRIYERSTGIVFQSFEYVFILSEGKTEVIKPENSFYFSFILRDDLYLNEPGKGVYLYKNGKKTTAPWSESLNNYEIGEILAYKQEGILFFTTQGNIFLYNEGKLSNWNTPANDFIIKNKFFCARKLDDEYYLLGSILDGMIIAGKDGNILQHINRNSGLQNNTILSTFIDNSDNLWLGLDNGIDYVEINSPLSFFNMNNGLGTGYAARVFEDKLYLGTNQGLYVYDLAEPDPLNKRFKLVTNSEGQVWTLDVIDNNLYCGHISGTFLIRNDNAIQTSHEKGTWKFLQTDSKPEVLIGGHFNGLVLYEKKNNIWKFKQKIKGFDVSSRFLEEGKGDIWVSHGRKGIYRLVLNQAMDSVIEINHFNGTKSLPSESGNIIYKLNDDIFVSTLNGFYVFDYSNMQFKPSEKYRKIFGISGSLQAMETDSDGNIWYIAQSSAGLLRLNPDNTYTRINKPLNPLKGNFVSGFESIYSVNSQTILTGLDNGFAHYSINTPKSYADNFNSYIMSIELPYLDSVIYLKNILSSSEFEFPFKKNSFRFVFTSPFFENQQNLLFSYILEGFSESWSDWSKNSFKDYTNLPEGEYVFKIKARNAYNTESEISEFSFCITPPWHRTSLAYYSYVILSIALLILTIKRVHKEVLKSKEGERQKHRTEIRKKEEELQKQKLISEKEIIRLRNDKLRSEMIYRDKELANQTMNIIQKNKLLSKLNEELRQIQEATEDNNLRTRLVVLNRRINREIDNKQQYKVFNTYFEEVHDAFFSRLKESHPDLSSREQYLSAYIRMNLSTKEIAALQNISYRGVEISRYRLRKKLKITRETNLSTYLANI